MKGYSFSLPVSGGAAVASALTVEKHDKNVQGADGFASSPNTVTLSFNLTQGGQPMNLSGAHQVKVVFDSNGQKQYEMCEIVNPASGLVKVLVPFTARQKTGLCTAEISVWNSTGIAFRQQFTYTVA